MQKIHITDKGLLIPSDCLSGLPRDMVVRRVKNRLIIESESQALVNEHLLKMVQKLRESGEVLGMPDENEVREIVDEVRANYAHHN